MKLKDEISKKLTGIQGSLHKFSNSARELGQQMRQVGREIAQVGHTISLTGAAITGPLLLAFKNAEKYSVPVKEQMDRMRNATIQFQVSIATALVPVMERFTNILGGLLNAWNGLGPVVQQQIVRGAMMVGIFLTVGGAITIVIGKLITMSGTILKLIGRFMAFAAANIPLMIIIGSLVIIIGLMIKFKSVADAVMNTLEVLFNYFLNGLETIKIAFSRFLAFVLGGLEKIYTFLGKIPGPIGKMNQSLADGLRIMRQELDKIGNQGITNIARNTEKVTKIFSGDNGAWAKGFDNLKHKAGKIWKLFQNPPKVAISQVVEAFRPMIDIARGTAQAMTQSFSQLFFNIFTGQLKNIKQVFADFGRQILQVIAQVMAKFILVKTIGNIGIGNGQKLASLFHQGGIVRAHQGLVLASDEVPIIAQSGEGVLSRKGMNALGRGNFDRLNRGESTSGGGGIVINVNPIVQLWDASDVQRNKALLVSAVSQAITQNGQIRKLIKEYG